MRIAVFGLGYVGTVTAAGLATHGHQVTGVDVDSVKVDLIRDGRSPVVEPGLDDLITESVEAGSLRATTDASVAMDRADVSLLCVGTPSTPRGDTDLTYLRRALVDIRGALDMAAPPDSGFHSVVVRSTVPPGTGAGLVAPAFTRTQLPAGWTVGTAMCPEFLREGSGVADFFDPPFVVLGADAPRVREAVSGMFGFLDRQVRHVDVRSAEALKYACNAFHATKVSFTNEMSRIFRALGIDSREVMDIFCEDRTAQHLPRVPAPGVRLRRVVPAQGRAFPAAHGPGERPRRPAARRGPADERDPDPRGRRPGDRRGVPRRRPARPELQEGHGRPAGEPERRARRATDRQGFRRPDLRPDRQPRAADGLQPPLRRDETAASAPAARAPAPRRPWRAATPPSSPRGTPRSCGPCAPTGPSGSSTSSAGSGPASRRSPGTRARGGRRDGPGTHHRPEPAGALRPPRVAGVPAP